MKIVAPDFKRMSRCGIPEVVYGGGKSGRQLAEIAVKFIKISGRMIATKTSPEKAMEVASSLEGVDSSYSEDSGVLVVRRRGLRKPKASCVVGLVTAGTSDIPVAEEARIVLEELGCRVVSAYDVGVAGVHRIYPALRRMGKASVIIVVAGMEGALPSVVSGLVDVPVIGVPTSVGYGVGAGGRAALYSMLTSCAPMAVVNIDNGYGAAVVAYQIARR